ncbi:hypothetical protein AB1462_17230 [Pseudomonas sp. SB113]|uniref:hypothetical protein n=1 Tax=Pseudomonas sp. SB113 TaxID=3154123 RepID=UPI00345D27A5
MTFDPRLQGRLYSQLDRTVKHFEQNHADSQNHEEAMSALFEEKLKLSSGMTATSTLTHFLNERVKVVINGIQ